MEGASEVVADDSFFRRRVPRADVPQIFRPIEELVTERNELIPIPEIAESLSRQLGEAAKGYMELHSSLAPVFEKMRQEWDAVFAGMNQEWVSLAAQLNEGLSALAAIDWEGVQRRTAADVMKMAELGWTVAPWLSLPDLAELAKLDSAASDAAFVELYFEGSGLADARAELVGSRYLASWEPLLQQILGALERREHLIAIPGLLLILEGFIAQFADAANPKQVCDTYVPKLLTNVRPGGHDGITALVWTSCVAFLRKLYSTVQFTEEAPSFINRHWILHGRDAADWTEADALRVLNALVSIHWLIRADERRAGLNGHTRN